MSKGLSAQGGRRHISTYRTSGSLEYWILLQPRGLKRQSGDGGIVMERGGEVLPAGEGGGGLGDSVSARSLRK